MLVRYSRPGVALCGSVISLALITSGCGTRVDRADRAAYGRPAEVSSDVADTSALESAESLRPLDAAGETDGTVRAGDTGSAVGTGETAQPRPSQIKELGQGQSPRGKVPSKTAHPSGSTSGMTEEQQDAPEKASGKAAPAPAGPSVQEPGRQGPEGPKSAIKVGNVGSYSGPAGPNFISVLEGVQLWVKAVNAAGGLNGHPVKLSVADNGGDPARHKALIQKAVERDRVLAFLGNNEVLSGPSAKEYLESKGIPTIGEFGGAQWAYESPMYFPQITSGDLAIHAMYGSAAQLALADGLTKLGVLNCVEAPVCEYAASVAEKQAQQRGMTLAWSGRASLAQPDFTAECLSARNAGVEVLIPTMDANSLRRIVGSCARQGFRPRISVGGQSIQAHLAEDPNLEGLTGMSQAFPFFQSNTPASKVFQSAMKRFGGGTAPTVGHSIGWVAGELFRRAAAPITEPPTTEALLEGLWSMQNDDLGGITGPLTFPRNGKAVPFTCWFNLVLRHGEFRSPDNFKRTCD